MDPLPTKVVEAAEALVVCRDRDEFSRTHITFDAGREGKLLRGELKANALRREGKRADACAHMRLERNKSSPPLGPPCWACFKGLSKQELVSMLLAYICLPDNGYSTTKPSKFTFCIFGSEERIRSVPLFISALDYHLNTTGWTMTQVVRKIEMSGFTYSSRNDLETGLMEVPIQPIIRWRQARILLSCLHRFQNILILKKNQEQTEKTARRVRTLAQAIRAIFVFKESAHQVKDLAKGISGDDLQEWRITLGSNEYHPRTARRLRTCIWEALHNFTQIVLVMAFVGSVVMGILEENEKQGWHDIFSAAIVVAIFILVTAISDYTQDRQFKHMIELKVLLKEVATFMGAVGFLVAVEVAYVVWLRDYFTSDNLNGSHPIPGDTLEDVIKISLIAVTIFVVAVPEVLLLSYNLILFSSIKKIKADKATVMRAAALETMASCENVICDKIAIASNEGTCKNGIKDAVELFQRHGSKVRMVTNDNLETARAIARECHILGSEASDENLIEGKVFRELSDSEREEVADKILVMAESSPEDKLLLVRALKKKGKVAVTGYVPDDAPALHEADVGLAMGIEGNEVVKELENSDIIIRDDNFAAVAKVFIWGRSVHEKVLKVMQQQLTANVVAVTINCMAAVYYHHIPLNAVQFMWVNLIIFGLGPLALATELPADHLMSRLPINRGQPLIYIPWKGLLIKVGYQIIALLVINFQPGSLLKEYPSDHATKVKNTMIFNTFVVCQISIEFGSRNTGILSSPLNWVTSNRVFLGIVGIILAIQFFIIEFLGKVFFIVRLNRKEWQFSLTYGIVDLFFAMLQFLNHLAQGDHH